MLEQSLGRALGRTGPASEALLVDLNASALPDDPGPVAMVEGALLGVAASIRPKMVRRLKPEPQLELPAADSDAVRFDHREDANPVPRQSGVGRRSRRRGQLPRRRSGRRLGLWLAGGKREKWKKASRLKTARAKPT